MNSEVTNQFLSDVVAVCQDVVDAVELERAFSATGTTKRLRALRIEDQARDILGWHKRDWNGESTRTPLSTRTGRPERMLATGTEG